jgi:hypothetical protein
MKNIFTIILNTNNYMNSINNLYINKFRTLNECCNYLKINRSHYYYLCLKYQLPNACSKKKK